MEPLISIVIPAYNIEGYIAKTLDSVLAQTYQNLQIIVVNDGSGDGTGKIIDDYAQQDRRVQAVHKENGGVTGPAERHCRGTGAVHWLCGWGRLCGAPDVCQTDGKYDYQ